MTFTALFAAVVGAVVRLLAQVLVAVSAPASVAPGEPALVRVEVTAPASADVRLTPPDVAPFAVVRAGRVPAVGAATVGVARGWRRHEWRYVLAPPNDARGHYAFAPFVAEAEGRGLRPWAVKSRAWSLDVRAPAPAAPNVGAALGAGRAAGANVPGAPAQGRASSAAAPAVPAAPARGSGVTFRARVYPDTVYVGQQATYELTVTVDAATRARIRRNPEFVPPELRGVFAVDLPASHEASADGDVHVYRRALFALAPGAVDIPSARLNYALALGLSFFSREERLAKRTEAVRFVAVAPPAAGRPAGWEGAVGALRAGASVASPAVRAGDPVEFTVRVEGEANVGLLPRPALSVPWADVVGAGDRVSVDSSAPAVRGAKEFTWILTPRAPGAFTTPAVRYPYFDPGRRAYAELVAPAVPVEVRPGAAAAAPNTTGPGAAAGAARGERLAVRTRWRGVFGAPLPSRPGFWLLLALAPAPAALVAAARGARRRRLARPADPERALRRLAPNGGAVDARALRRLTHDAFAARVGFEPSAFAGAAAFGRALRRVGVTGATADRAAALVAALDAAAFDGARGLGAGRDAGGAPALADEARAVLRDVDREAQSRLALGVRPGGPGAAARGPAAGAGARGWLLAAALAGTAAALAACAAGCHSAARGAAADRAATTAFARGVRAYGRDSVAAARVAFLDAAARAPRAPDAWANAGTAAWAAGDTLAAAVAWQRAARLEPAADDVRDRLALLPAAQDGWIAGVPPVDPDWLAYPALALAVAAGALALRQVSRATAAHGASPHAPPARAAVARGAGAWPWTWTWGIALAIAGAGAALAAHASPADRAVVTAGGPLRTEPALGAEPGPPADPTDVARVVARQGTWTRVALDGGRDGWIESGRLAPLEAAPGSATAAGAPND